MKKALCILSIFASVVFDTKAQSPGDVIVTEFMANPSLVADNLGEWFEILNVSNTTIDINKWKIKDNGTNNHTINNAGPLLIAPGTTLVLAINSNSNTNGGLTVNYTYSGFTLANTTDEIILTDSLGTVIDQIAYSNPANGKSWNLDPAHYNATDNDNFTYWCPATLIYGLGDFGTPGFANTSCGLSGLETLTNNETIVVQKLEHEILIHLKTQTKNQKWQITDVSGKIILSGSTNHQAIISFSSEKMNTGIYFFSLIETGNVIKMIVD
jgi:Lamin Tail Domain